MKKLLRLATLFALFFALSFSGQAFAVSDKTAASVPSTDTYRSCDGTTFFGNCANDSCVPSHLARIYGIWREKFKEKYKISPEAFDSYIEITKVEEIPGPPSYWVRVNYIYKIGQIRSRQTDSIDLGPGPLELQNEPPDKEVERAVNLALPDFRDFSYTEGRSVTSAELNSLISKRYFLVFGKPKYDFCHIDFDRAARELTLPGRGTLFEPLNLCFRSSIGLSSRSVKFTKDPCIHW